MDRVSYSGTSIYPYNNTWEYSRYNGSLLTAFPHAPRAVSVEGPLVPLVRNTVEILTDCYNSLPDCRGRCRNLFHYFFNLMAQTTSSSEETAVATRQDMLVSAQATRSEINANGKEIPNIEWRTQHAPSVIQSYHVEVEKDWKIYVEESGNSQGLPVVFVHGGPGAHFKPTDHQWFDPKRYRIILFQQRGTYQCQPSAEDLSIDGSVFQNIGIETLAKDIEVLRDHLGISQWLVFGGSWGSTLGLYYAQEYPNSCSGLILRGIFLSSHDEMRDSFSSEKIDAKVPNWNRTALEHIQNYASSQGLDSSPEQMCHSYRIMILERNDMKAAMLWRLFEKYIELRADPAMLQRLLDESAKPTGEERSVGLWETQMFDQIIKRIDLLDESRMRKLATMPIKIVHGKQDTLCPVSVAKSLTRKLKQLGASVALSLIEGGQHSPYSHPGMIDALVRATDQFAVSSTFTA